MKIKKDKVEEALEQGLEDPGSKKYKNALKQLSEDELRDLIKKIKKKLGRNPQ